ncbi:MAG: polysaccharide deacetylase [Pseudonocardia sp.]|uniref:polysaccharide deacetylase n=1 Tax=Pseudonocardia sp. TaxID=60912 RepID=UPI001AD0383D|nr:polysaccharide deacetylase [Pseudonocardia sp.]MBN9102522.1 polysaccharide deacetylase [Pseudonocardia sp.]
MRRLLRNHIPLTAALLLAVAMVIGNQIPVAPARALAGVPAPDRAAARLAAVMHPLASGEKPPQFVLFSFDGAGSHDHWQKIMALAGPADARVTGFLWGLYLLDDSGKQQYRGPGHAPGKSSIGFGGSDADVATLVSDLNEARSRGHEIGTHYNGHFCAGSEPSVGKWTSAMWGTELDEFFGFVDGARARGLELDPATIKGGRTPCLEGRWDQAFPAMRAHGLTYDSSRPSDGIAWPTEQDGIREFWMPTVRVPALHKKVIMMDYNLWYSLNGAKDDPSRATEFTTATLDTYRAAYDAAFTGNRAPIVVGNHFNTWSGGAFFGAVEQFLPEVCVRPETVCATYSEVNAWMDLQDPAVLATWSALPHAQVPA